MNDQLIRLSDLQWPRSRADLTNDYPTTWFPDDLTACDLAEFDHAVPLPTAPPQHDPATHQAVAVRPVQNDIGTWIQAWHIIEIAPPTPTPDWNAFYGGIQTRNGFREAFLAAFEADKMTWSSLASRLDEFRLRGNYTLFLESLYLALGLVDSATAIHLASELRQLSVECCMPVAFIDSLDAFSQGLANGT